MKPLGLLCTPEDREATILPDLYEAPTTPARLRRQDVASGMLKSESEPSLSPSGVPGSPVRQLCPGSGRFKQDEMPCFKKKPIPSPAYKEKAEVYCKSGLLHKQGDFYRFSVEHFRPSEEQVSRMKSAWQDDQPEELSCERETAAALDRLFPIGGQLELERPSRSQLTTSKRRGLVPPGSAGALGDGGKSSSSSPSKTRSKPVGDKALKKAQHDAGHAALLVFRSKMLDKFCTLRAAFETFAHEITGGMDRELSRKDFAKFVDRHFTGLTREDHAHIFTFLDSDRSGKISIAEFHNAIEAVAPVRNMEDMRRKLIALGHGSMRRVVREIDGYSRGGKMNQQEFASALTRLGIEDDMEHQSIWNILHDPHGGTKTVTVDQINSAMAAVSPSLMLEDTRDKLISKYGALGTAYNAINIDCDCTLARSEFTQAAVGTWKMTTFEADKAFRHCDIDRSRLVSRTEFLSAMNLVEPTLFHEDIRKKVRQRFRCINEAIFKDDYGNTTMPREQHTVDWAKTCPLPSRPPQTSEGARPLGAKLNKRGTVGLAGYSGAPETMLDAFKNAKDEDEALRKQTPNNFSDNLAQVQLSESETAALFSLVDIDNDGELTAMEFSRGVRLFAPAVVLDDLRTRCLRGHSSVADAFMALPPERHHIVLEKQGLRDVLQDLDLVEGVNVEGILDLIEPRSEASGLMICELVAALQAAAPGTHTPLPADQRDARARQQVKHSMAPFRNSARDLRSDLRTLSLGNLKDDDKGQPRRALPELCPRTKVSEIVEEPTCAPDSFETSRDSRASRPMKQSYSRVSKYMRTSKHEEAEPIVERLHGYYSTASSAMDTDDQLLSATKKSRYQNFQKLCGHRAILERPANTKRVLGN